MRSSHSIDRAMTSTHGWPQTLSLIPTAWLLLFVFLPSFFCLIQSFQSEAAGGWSLQSYTALSKPPYFRIFASSVAMALASGVLALAFAYPAALFLRGQSRETQTAKRFRILVLAYPFLGNAFLRLYSLKYFLSERGAFWLGFGDHWKVLYTQSTVVLGLAYTLFPLAIIPLYLSVLEIPTSQLEAAKDLGASSLQTFRHLILPLSWHAAQQSLIMVFMPALGLFYVSDALGGGKHPILGNLIKEQVLTLKNFPLACATNTSLFLIFQLFFKSMLYLQRWWTGKRKEDESTRS